MERLTEYDYLSRCFKCKPNQTGNIVQRLGELEDEHERLLRILDSFDSDDDVTPVDVLMQLRELYGY